MTHTRPVTAYPRVCYDPARAAHSARVLSAREGTEYAVVLDEAPCDSRPHYRVLLAPTVSDSHIVITRYRKGIQLG